MRKPFTMTFGQFIDQLTIVSKKAMCGLPGAQKELDTMLAWCKTSKIDGEFILAIIRVAQCNLTIWDLEHSVRNAAEGSIPLSEVGRRAIMIRNTNKTRIENKNILDKRVFVEEKIKHLSEGTYERFYKAAGISYVGKTREEGGLDE
jgi:hypothetical protein